MDLGSENKGVDQLGGYCTAHLHLCFSQAGAKSRFLKTQLTFYFRMASFESSGEEEERQYQKYPIRRLEPSIQKFLKVINIDLGRLHQHKLNIEKVCIYIDYIYRKCVK